MEYIHIEKELIPYKFDMTFKGETFRFGVNYNSINDFFTLDLYKNGETIVLGEKLVYGKPLFLSCQHKQIPKIYILPYDLSGSIDRITFENLGEQVLLYLVDGDADGTV